MNSIEDAQKEIIDEFSPFEDWFEKYEHIIELGKALETSEGLRKEENSISGCQSEVWLKVEGEDGRIRIMADSDAMITRGMIALLVRVLDGQKPEDVANAKLYFLDEIGLKSNLSPSRANGLGNIIKRIKDSIRQNEI